jgi:hypothetical protein
LPCCGIGTIRSEFHPRTLTKMPEQTLPLGKALGKLSADK